MDETTTTEKVNKDEIWRERIGMQQGSGMSIRQFCKTQGISDHSFYAWRKRLREPQQTMRFALVDRGAQRPEPAPGAELELVLPTGERLRIGAGVQAKTLRMVLEALRA